MKIEELRKKRMALQVQLEAIQAEEQAMAEKRLRELAEEILDEVKNLGYGAWAYEPDGEDGLKVKITRRRSGSLGIAGQVAVITAPDGKVYTFSSAAKGARHFGIDLKGASGPAVLRAKGYDVVYTKQEAATVMTEDESDKKQA